MVTYNMEKGYLLVPQVFTEHELEQGDCLQGDKVDYLATKAFMDRILLNKIKQHTDMSDPCYGKFRVSQQASTFHGDIYNHTSSEIMSIYTCLVYFEDAQIEVIPESHRPNRGWSHSSYQKREVLTIHRGDLLVFHANLHHRELDNRRVLSVFEVFPDRMTYDACSPRLTVIHTSSSLIQQMGYVLCQYVKHPGLIEWFTFFHYILLFNGLLYKIGLMDLAPWDKTDKYISYEPLRCVYLDKTQYDDLNVNILCDRSVHNAPPCFFYLYLYLLYLIVSFGLSYFYHYRIKPTRRNSNQRTRKS